MSRRSLIEYLAGYGRHGRSMAYSERCGYRMERWSYRDVGGVAAQFARELEARRIGPGDRVLLWGRNSAEWVAAFFGCILRGAVGATGGRKTARRGARTWGQRRGSGRARARLASGRRRAAFARTVSFTNSRSQLACADHLYLRYHR